MRRALVVALGALGLVPFAGCSGCSRNTASSRDAGQAGSAAGGAGGSGAADAGTGAAAGDSGGGSGGNGAGGTGGGGLDGGGDAWTTDPSAWKNPPWNPPACNVLRAVDLDKALPPLDWIACNNGIAGCVLMDTSKLPGAGTFNPNEKLGALAGVYRYGTRTIFTVGVPRAARIRLDQSLGRRQWRDLGSGAHPAQCRARGAAQHRAHMANALATALHVPANRVTGILNATRALTPDTALRLERFSPGTTAQFWLNLQSAYDLRRAEFEASKDSQKIRPFKATG